MGHIERVIFAVITQLITGFSQLQRQLLFVHIAQVHFVTQQLVIFKRAPLAVLALGHVHNKSMGVQIRVKRPGRFVTKRCHNEIVSVLRN
ncbi:hypothetical protein HmCmsJML008_04791 [Escherichia coli]|nr:hypothetical protein HmCmsJML008_04791 [Escherichia coli]